MALPSVLTLRFILFLCCAHRLALRAFRHWCRIRGLYSSKLGYLNGVTAASMVAYAHFYYYQFHETARQIVEKDWSWAAFKKAKASGSFPDWLTEKLRDSLGRRSVSGLGRRAVNLLLSLLDSVYTPKNVSTPVIAGSKEAIIEGTNVLVLAFEICAEWQWRAQAMDLTQVSGYGSGRQWDSQSFVTRSRR